MKGASQIAIVLFGLLASTAWTAVPTCSANDARTSTSADCQDAANRADEARDVGRDSTHAAQPSDARRPPDATKHDDASDDDDEDTCITKAANGVCLDEDED